ncbi:venom serine protease [Sergentomyia squamirostris]
MRYFGFMRFNIGKAHVFIGGFFLPWTSGQACHKDLTVGTTPVSFSSANYPLSYGRDTQCTWQATAFEDYRLTLTCMIQIPDGTTGCPKDYIEISRTGRTDFADGQKYCGLDTFTEYSNYNQMSIKLSSLSTSPGGRFSCTIQAFFNPCNCGRRKSTRIVGGREASVNEFPMVAGIVDSINKEIYCGATLISNYLALTATHCVSKKSLSTLGLVVGEHDVTTNKETTYTKIYRLQSATCYSGNCDLEVEPGDIAILKTIAEIQMNPGVGIACLPWKYYTENETQFASETVEVAGWGLLEFAGKKATVLQKVALNVLSTPQCKEAYGNTANDNYICTYTPGKDTCQMDSGNGLLWTGSDNGRLYEIGVLSKGLGCASNTPALSERVTRYLNWIYTNSPESSYCNV